MYRDHTEKYQEGFVRRSGLRSHGGPEVSGEDRKTEPRKSRRRCDGVQVPRRPPQEDGGASLSPSLKAEEPGRPTVCVPEYEGWRAPGSHAQQGKTPSRLPRRALEGWRFPPLFPLHPGPADWMARAHVEGGASAIGRLTRQSSPEPACWTSREARVPSN